MTYFTSRDKELEIKVSKVVHSLYFLVFKENHFSHSLSPIKAHSSKQRLKFTVPIYEVSYFFQVLEVVGLI